MHIPTVFVALLLLVALGSAKPSNSSSIPVTSLPGIGDVNAFAGYLAADTTGENWLWHMMWVCPNESAPVILWLQGGPGCSSTFGNFIENGPYQMQHEGTFANNTGSWLNSGHLLYIDQPAGTGYSLGGGVTDELQMATQLVTALEAFYALHPDLLSHRLFISGESYAGHYLTALAYYYLNHNSKALPRLAGMMMGDGWVNGIYQTPSYSTYMLSVGIIDSLEDDFAQVVADGYIDLVDGGLYDAASIVDGDLLNGLLAAAGGIDPYDYKYHEDPTNVPDAHLTKWLNQKSVITALHADERWVECNTAVYLRLIGDESKSTEVFMPLTLDSGVPILLYNGGDDIICNWIGTAAYSDTLQWQGSPAFSAAVNSTWHVDGKAVGWGKSGGGLTRIIVNGAGHMAPFFEPISCKGMVEQFVATGTVALD